MGRKKNLDKLKEFKRELNRHIAVNKIILFGSRAKGKTTQFSDFDLLIISKKFKGKDPLVRSLGFYKYWNLDCPVDFLCYTPKEYDKLKNKISIIQQVEEEGITI